MRARGENELELFAKIRWVEIFLEDWDASWDSLFRVIGPTMLNEATEDALREALRADLLGFFRHDAYNAATVALEAEGEIVDEHLEAELDLFPEDFATLIIQLRALGLITKSEKPRSVKDTATYWTLTPYGDQHLTRLIAIRRKDSA